MMNRARSAPAWSTTASSESIHSWVSTGSMSGSCCLNWSKTSCIGRCIVAYGTDRCSRQHRAALCVDCPAGDTDDGPWHHRGVRLRQLLPRQRSGESGIPPQHRPARPTHRVLILGGGFGGVMTARALERLLGRRQDVEIWLVNRENFFLFTPLLPEVCAGRLEARHVVVALRAMVRRASTWCITADVEKIDVDEPIVTVMGGDGDLHRLRYDT